MQVNVTVSINGPSGQELAATHAEGSDKVRVTISGDYCDVTLANLRALVAKLEASNAN